MATEIGIRMAMSSNMSKNMLKPMMVWLSIQFSV